MASHPGVRDLLADYLNEIHPGMDYGSLEVLAYGIGTAVLVEILPINPERADLRLSTDVITAWA